jgi:2-dehydropantoate 2-reductase
MVRLYPDALAMKWSKLVTNLIANATSAILDMTPAEIFANPDLFQLEMGQIKEALSVITALDLPFVNLPGTPVRLLVFAVQSCPCWITQPILIRRVRGGRGGKMPSFHIDLHAGHGKSEVGYLNGAVARFGDGLGVPTPINRQLTEILTRLTNGELKPNPFAHKPDELLRELKLT